jgi:ribosomal-protein-alanine N-acetyltransferase
MGRADLRRVAAIENEVSPSPWGRRLFADCLHVGYDCQVLAGLDTIIGFSVTSVAAAEGHLLNLAVVPEYQRRGYGRKLLEAAWQAALDRGATCLFLEVRVSNGRAIRLYEAAGFQVVGMRREYYQRGPAREDALVMRLGHGD